jgi:hypothetical protein
LDWAGTIRSIAADRSRSAKGISSVELHTTSKIFEKQGSRLRPSPMQFLLISGCSALRLGGGVSGIHHPPKCVSFEDAGPRSMPVKFDDFPESSALRFGGGVSQIHHPPKCVSFEDAGPRSMPVNFEDFPESSALRLGGSVSGIHHPPNWCGLWVGTPAPQRK